MICVDKESLKAAKTLLDDQSPTSVCKTGNILYQLRQTRTHFDSPATYTLCRASGPITKRHICHPYTIFTINELDRGRSPYAPIFEVIAEKNGKGKEHLGNILVMYNNDSDSIPILHNSGLNKELEGLANLFMPSIVTANASVESHIQDIFEYLD
ncbi:hypothetical protein EC973_005496 [Apophysomyces ossiformis]|uniref:Uncharacterized protein n=1 Tax=Apophysomyces ossiformis TaxID=679940 RepID=A0A8H7EM18_9FUNG|nr:hypothetical protein EC973_005496 [Apophysomyces ossiformis]